MSEPTICGCRKVERVDFVTGQKFYVWDTSPVECEPKNRGECPDYEYYREEPEQPIVCVQEEPKKHWRQR